MRLFKFVALAVVIAFAAQGFSPVHVQAQDKGTIKIATQSPLSGGQSEAGIAIRNGAQLAVDQLSGAINKLGYKVQLVPYDDQADSKVGPVNAQNIVADKSILAIIGHYNSGVARPSMKIYNDANLAMVSPANTAVDITDTGLPIVNRVCGRDDTQGAAGANFAINTLHVKTAYVVSDKTVYGDGVAKFFAAAFKAAGGTLLGQDSTTETANFDSVLAPIITAKPDLLYFGGIYNQGAVFFKQAHDKGVTAQFMGPDGFDDSSTAKIGGDAVVGMVYTTTAAPAALSPDSAQFRADYKAKYGNDAPAYAPEAFVSTAIALAAIEKGINDNGGKLPDRMTVATNVRATKGFKSILGTITFDAHGDPQIATYYVLKIGSKDPTAWAKNEALAKSQALSPLSAAAGMTIPAEGTPAATMSADMSATMAATMAATAAK